MPILHPAFRRLSPNLKSEYIRGVLLLFFGGMWIDADTIGWENLNYQFGNFITQKIFFVIRQFDLISRLCNTLHKITINGIT